MTMFMMLFLSSVPTVRLVILGVDGIVSALVYATICFVAAIAGLVAIEGAIRKSGRVSPSCWRSPPSWRSALP